MQEHLAVVVPEPGLEAGWAEPAAEGEAAVGAEVDRDPEHVFGVTLADMRRHAGFGQQGGRRPLGAGPRLSMLCAQSVATSGWAGAACSATRRIDAARWLMERAWRACRSS